MGQDEAEIRVDENGTTVVKVKAGMATKTFRWFIAVLIPVVGYGVVTTVQATSDAHNDQRYVKTADYQSDKAADEKAKQERYAEILRRLDDNSADLKQLLHERRTGN
jgi:hypothetical protein